MYIITLEFLECGILQFNQLSYTEVKYVVREKQVSAVHYCPLGFAIRGNRERTCNADGTWDGTVSPCGMLKYWVVI